LISGETVEPTSAGALSSGVTGASRAIAAGAITSAAKRSSVVCIFIVRFSFSILFVCGFTD
jgi:hypothetical protein